MVKILWRNWKKFIVEITEEQLDDLEDNNFWTYVNLPPLNKKGAEKLAKQLQHG